MSRSAREMLERAADMNYIDYLYDINQRQAEQGMHQAWLADQAAQAEFNSWLDLLEQQRVTDR